MNSLKRAEKLWLKGEITDDEYLELRRAYGVSEKPAMKTAEEIIAYLEAALSEAIELHDNATDLAQKHATLLKAYTISELLDEIKEQ